MKRIGVFALWALGIFLVVRALAEPFTIDENYADDWGGPTKAGVLAVHMGPGLIAAAVMVWVLTRRRRARADHSVGHAKGPDPSVGTTGEPGLR
jgi:hypothetical protein